MLWMLWWYAISFGYCICVYLLGMEIVEWFWVFVDVVVGVVCESMLLMFIYIEL